MFFFIAGVQPRTIRIEKLEMSCPLCGHNTLYKKRIDHYLSLFFIPFFPLKRGNAFTACDNCGALGGDAAKSPFQPRTEEPNRCSHCRAALDPTFQYCPYCGRRLGRR
ncbi:MAG: zinc ribbon domain-containing protein [Deltaproteobacteria bacterium]|nr:zinc ribbon domain-containing protein [Deltaproteobacteria bacterium]